MKAQPIIIGVLLAVTAAGVIYGWRQNRARQMAAKAEAVMMQRIEQLRGSLVEKQAALERGKRRLDNAAPPPPVLASEPAVPGEKDARSKNPTDLIAADAKLQVLF